MKGKITKRKVDSLVRADHDVKLWDTEIPGFGLKVTPKGKKVFVLQYWAPGQAGVRRTYTIGVYGSPVIRERNGQEETRDLTADLARDLAREFRADIQRGADPSGAKGAARVATKTQTLAVLSTAFLEEAKANCKPTTYRFYKNIFTSRLIPEFGRIVVSAISYEMIAALHLKLQKKPVHANRCKAVLSAFLSWCMKNSFRPNELNPCSLVKKYPEKKRQRFLDDNEIARLGDVLDTAAEVGLQKGPEYVKYDEKRPKKPENKKHTTKANLIPHAADPFGVAAIRFLVLTGFRSGEVFSLKWDIVDLRNSTIGLPDTKTGESYRCVGEPVVQFLKTLPRIEGSPWVFPSRAKAGRTHLTSVQRLWYSVRAAAGLPGVRIHDLRHTYASAGINQGKSLFIVGKLLGHKHAATTQRYAHLADNTSKAAADDVSKQMASALFRGAAGKKARSKRGAKRQEKTQSSRRRSKVGKESRRVVRKGTKHR